MVVVVVLGAGPEGKPVPERERKVIAAVRRDRLAELVRQVEESVRGRRLRTEKAALTLSVIQISIVSRWRLCVRAQKMSGPPIVPEPSRRTSSGWAYSAVKPNGAGNSWCTLWIHLQRREGKVGCLATYPMLTLCRRDALVQQRRVQPAMRPVVNGVFDDKEEGDLADNH